MTVTKMTNHKKCFARDNKIVEYVKRWGFLSTDQIAHLIFGGTKTSKRLAQRRLKYLVKENILQRKRVSFDEPYIYWYNAKKNILQAAHIVATNWIIIKLLSEKLGYEMVTMASYEDDYDILRCDCFVEIYNDKEKNYRHYFIEADISHNDFDKVVKYNKLYENYKDIKQSWIKRTEGFPTILITTHRKKSIEKRLFKENKHGLEFQIFDYDELRRRFV
ncbi:hypothetical protein BHU72_14835 [Desulfuribacillus stibiiarsenatis]|uniref:Replication-relaxation n=1 Tax=Desulfuribacillus stibiiarsenatis TaxID=1390249 RepID=A0A1E5L7C7_9FIRM|nr:hypothetical protein [Desulfuribacillus stibiiarsenatis]OEH86026.1 hypothetical protein BHU72_14835 [Desulfuribacillus stibiiarsenatis]